VGACTRTSSVTATASNKKGGCSWRSMPAHMEYLVTSGSHLCSARTTDKSMGTSTVRGSARTAFESLSGNVQPQCVHRQTLSRAGFESCELDYVGQRKGVSARTFRGNRLQRHWRPCLPMSQPRCARGSKACHRFGAGYFRCGAASTGAGVAALLHLCCVALPSRAGRASASDACGTTRALQAVGIRSHARDGPH
jgi:hypothetical protein